MARVELAPAAQADIRAVLVFTRRRFGVAKAQQYRQLIADARQRLAETPTLGKAHPEIDPDARLFHISQPGKAARHLFAYRLRDNGQVVQIIGLLYDGMDLRRRWRTRAK